MNLKTFFLKHCEDQQYEVNQNQLNIVGYLKVFYSENFTQFFLTRFFKKKK